MDSPTGRLPFAIITGHPHMLSVFVYSFLLLLIVCDLWSLRRVHRATIWASLFVVIAQELRLPIGSTGPWVTFAGWVKHLARSL
jgi:hypothetical protein